MKKQSRFIFAAFCASAISSQAQLAEYNFNFEGATTAVLSDDLSSSPLFAATASDPNVTATNLGVDPGLTGLTYVTNAVGDYFQIAEGNGISDGVHPDDVDITEFVDAAYEAGDYFEFTLTADSGFTLDLTDLTFDFARAIRGTNDYAVRTSVDSFVSYVALVNQAAPEGNAETEGAGQLVDLSGAPFQGLSEITFQIVFDDRQNNNGGGSASVIDDIIVNGSAVSTAADSDSDSDGQSDAAEAIAGTDPSNPNSVFKIIRIEGSQNGEVELTWNSIPGKTYMVETSSDLNVWTEIATLEASVDPATTTTQDVDVPLASETTKFYRLRVR